LLDDFSDWAFLDRRVHRSRLSAEWKPLKFKFDPESKGRGGFPDVACSYLSGLIGLRKPICDILFPVPDDAIEFLSIMVNGNDWLLVNCLASVKSYDAQTSCFHRDACGGEIYWIDHVEFPRHPRQNGEVFTLEDSNRAELLVVEPFRDRFLRSSLRGLNFREVGRICS
jgi:hypothetical protein